MTVELLWFVFLILFNVIVAPVSTMPRWRKDVLTEIIFQTPLLFGPHPVYWYLGYLSDPPPPSPPIIWNWRVHYFLDRDTLMELFFLLFVEGINNLTKLSKMTLLVINFDFDVIPKVFEFLQHFLNQLCLA